MRIETRHRREGKTAQMFKGFEGLYRFKGGFPYRLAWHGRPWRWGKEERVYISDNFNGVCRARVFNLGPFSFRKYLTDRWPISPKGSPPFNVVRLDNGSSINTEPSGPPITGSEVLRSRARQGQLVIPPKGPSVWGPSFAWQFLRARMNRSTFPKNPPQV